MTHAEPLPITDADTPSAVDTPEAKRRKANFREIEQLKGVVAEHEATIAALLEREKDLLGSVTQFYKDACAYLADKVIAEKRCVTYRKWQPYLVGLGALLGALALAAIQAWQGAA